MMIGVIVPDPVWVGAVYNAKYCTIPHMYQLTMMGAAVLGGEVAEDITLLALTGPPPPYSLTGTHTRTVTASKARVRRPHLNLLGQRASDL